MASETSFSVAESDRGLGVFWRSLADLWFFGWIGHLCFSTLADTAAERGLIQQAYTFDLQSHEITRHGLPGGHWHREVPYTLG